MQAAWSAPKSARGQRRWLYAGADGRRGAGDISACLCEVPYRPAARFAPISLVTSSEYILAVHPSLPAERQGSSSHWRARVRGGSFFLRPGTSFAASGGLLEQSAGIDMLHVPYKGGGPAATAILSGKVSLMWHRTHVVPHAKAGRLRLLTIASCRRSPAIPELPALQKLYRAWRCARGTACWRRRSPGDIIAGLNAGRQGIATRRWPPGSGAPSRNRSRALRTIAAHIKAEHAR